MKYIKIPAQDYLKSYIQYFWALQIPADNTLSKTFITLADGCPGILFSPFDQTTFFDENNNRLPNMFLYGQTITPTKIYSQADTTIIGICFQPTALKPIFGIDSYELTSSCASVDDISDKKSLKFLERISPLSSVEEQVKLLSAYLFSQLEKNNIASDKITEYSSMQIIKSQGNLSLKDLQKDILLSERSLERKFNQSIGISPKLFSKICRFQSSLNQLKNGNYTNLSDIAFDSGYADQSHFIKVFKEFTGLTPYQYQKQTNTLVSNFPELLI